MQREFGICGLKVTGCLIYSRDWWPWCSPCAQTWGRSTFQTALLSKLPVKVGLAPPNCTISCGIRVWLLLLPPSPAILFPPLYWEKNGVSWPSQLHKMNVASWKSLGRSLCSFLGFTHEFFCPAPELALPCSSANNGFMVNISSDELCSVCQSSPLGDCRCRSMGLPQELTFPWPMSHVVSLQLAASCKWSLIPSQLFCLIFPSLVS